MMTFDTSFYPVGLGQTHIPVFRAYAVENRSYAIAQFSNQASESPVTI
jgi:hypothetical protein